MTWCGWIVAVSGWWLFVALAFGLWVGPRLKGNA